MVTTSFHPISRIWNICFPLLIFASACTQSINWETRLERAGSSSSPRAIDLNNDQVKDIVLGAGGMREWEPSENGVIALDGKTGAVLWKKACRNQMIGSPVFMEIDGDGIPDVIIGGRSAQLMALSGANGQVIWEFMGDNDDIDFKEDTTILNFFNPQLIEDINGDNQQDLLIAYGGYVNARPYDTRRPVGYLMVLSSTDGEVLAKAPMPDGKETYMSPVMYPNGPGEMFFFGTGGETIPGNFYLTTLADLLDGKITEHQLLASGTSKGFIAPPVLADIDGDSIPDVIVNAYEGKVYAFSGQSFDPLWMVDVGDAYETHSQPVPGNFVGGPTTDFFINFCKGTWPDVTGAIQIVVDGSTGLYQVVDTLGNLQYSSPVTMKKLSDKRDRVGFPINEKYPNNYAPELGYPPFDFSNSLYIMDIDNQKNTLLSSSSGTNVGSTLLVEDLNDDGSVEVIYVVNQTPHDPFESRGITITSRTMKGYSSTWNQYMGPGARSHLPERSY